MSKERVIAVFYVAKGCCTWQKPCSDFFNTRNSEKNKNYTKHTTKTMYVYK